MNLSAHQYRSLLFVLALAAFILTFHFYAQPVEPGLDSSWKYAHNRFFVDDVRPGRDVIGTYGPFGFLVNTMPVGSNMRIAFWFEVLVRMSLVLTFVFLFLGERDRPAVDRIMPGLMLLLLLVTVNRGEKTPGLELVALSAGLVFTAYRKNSPVFLAGAVVLTSLALLIKFSIGILCLSFVCVYGLWMLARQREIVKPALWLSAPFLSATAVWLALYGDFQGLGDYLIGSLQQSQGYASAMTSLNAPDAPGWIAAGLAALLLLLFTIRKERDLLFLFLLLLPGFLISIKYGVTKQPQFLFHYSLLMLLLLAGQAKTLTRQLSMMAIMSLCLFFLDLNTGFLEPGAFRFDTAEPVVKPPDLAASLRQSTDFAAYEQRLRSASAALLEPARLSDKALSLIGDSPVDTYPWEISFIPANDLNWRPRPVFQSYFTYTPWLDRRNEAFFRSGRAPEFILWDRDRGDRLQSIDGRYLLNDEPLTIIQILSSYDLAGYDHNAIIFRKRTMPALRQPVMLPASGPLAWNSGFEVPFRKEGIIRARLQYSRTPSGRLRRMLYRESPMFVDYLLESGEMLRCRLVLDNADNGIWVNPFVMSLLPPSSAGRVVGIRIINPDAEKGSFAPRFSVQWEFIAFDGPPAPYFLTRRIP